MIVKTESACISFVNLAVELFFRLGVLRSRTPTKRSQNGTQESGKMRLFLGKSALFASFVHEASVLS